MSPIEIAALEVCLRSYDHPVQALEWGSGSSTAYYACIPGFGCEWVSIEHDPVWAEATQRRLDLCGLSHVHLNVVPSTGPRIGDGRIEEFQDYITYPEQLESRFHFILVDGRARVECLRIAWERLLEEGVMVLHDGEREEYKAGWPHPHEVIRIPSRLEGVEKELLLFFKSGEKCREIQRKLDERHTTDGPLVSVIMPTYNRNDLLEKALDSLCAQTYTPLELVLVNDAGKDVSPILEPYRKTLNITYIQHETNQGISAARNTAFQHAQGRYISYLDDDDHYYPWHLKSLVRYLEQTGQSVVYSLAERITLKQQEEGWIETDRDIPFRQEVTSRNILIRNCVPNLCLLHKRDCLASTGGFDEGLETHVDWEFLIRLTRTYPSHFFRVPTCAFTTRSDGSNITSKRALMLKTLRQIYEMTADDPELDAETKAARRAFERSLMKEVV